MPRKRDISQGDTGKLDCEVTRALNDTDMITVRIKGYDTPITIDPKWLVNHVKRRHGEED